MTSFGERLREIRIKAGETQAEAGMDAFIEGLSKL